MLSTPIRSILIGGILGSIGTAYMPIYSGLTETQGERAGKRFTDQVLTLVGTIGMLTALFGILFSHKLVELFAATEFSSASVELAGFYLKFFFVCNVLVSFVGILTAHLQYHGQFLRQIAAGYSFDLVLIAAILYSARTNCRYLALGTLFAYLAYLLLVAAAASRRGYRYAPSLGRNSNTRQLISLAVPVFIGSSITQINTAVDRFLASSLPEGSISALNYGYLLMGLIITFAASILNTIAYPRLAQAVSRNDWEFFNAAAQRCVALIVVISVPFSLGAVAFADQVVQVVFERRAFDAASTSLVSGAFRYYSFGIVFSAFSGLLVTAFQSMRKVKIPVICSALSVVCNIAFNLLFVGVLQHRGIALATSIAAVVNSAALSFCAKKSGLHVFPPIGKLLKVAAASLASVSAAVGVYRLLQRIWMPRILYLGFAAAAAVLLYLLLLWLLKMEELDILRDLFDKTSRE